MSLFDHEMDNDDYDLMGKQSNKNEDLHQKQKQKQKREENPQRNIYQKP